eukprot:8045645-Alexandrium_andersonii.AAC.1
MAVVEGRAPSRAKSQASARACRYRLHLTAQTWQAPPSAQAGCPPFGRAQACGRAASRNAAPAGRPGEDMAP